MQPLKTYFNFEAFGGIAKTKHLDASAGMSSALVLPRFLRRSARVLKRIYEGGLQIPKGFGWVASGFWFAALLIYGASISGGVSSVIDRLAHISGFGVELHISGHEMTSSLDIYASLGGQTLQSLVGVDLIEARQTIENLPWVEHAVLTKFYPQQLDIKITERAPFAVWQRGNRLTVVEKSGAVITDLNAAEAANNFGHLPLFVGSGAEKTGAVFLSQMDAFPALKSKVSAYVRVAERRWNLHLNEGPVLLLPADGYAEALLDISELDTVYGLLERDIESVDFRLPDRVALKLSENADTRRAAAVEERAKIMKQRRKARGARL